MRPEPFKGACSAAVFMSQRETSVGTRNNILLVSSLLGRIKTVFHIPGKVIIGLLQQHCWID